ncbi:MAG: DNA polymerase III subunit beta [Alicyclobacillus herbarius]|uniref:DNA polymerase III subunit beta n=1 Tax=Alicyclobacillus herbarius TaxID=122960 RepID=UPI0023579CFD|nr:DNA polymerase III subunit beta [Alicyclobacillus herbarius]MCL6633767.1 DNA polymerase III subunit beta [Alicyclobacillus herbarius]
MKVMFNHVELEKVLRDVVRVVPTSTNKVVLKHILIKADKDEERVDVYASSLDMSIRRTLYQEAADSPVVIEDSGACLLPAKELFEIVKRAKDQITLASSEKKAQIAFGKTKYELSGLEPDLFTPYTDNPNDTTTAVLLAPDLHRLLRRTTYAVYQGDARPVLNGVNLTVSDTGIHAVATDGARLAEHSVPCKSVSGEPRSLPVPAALLDKLAAALPARDDDEEVILTLGPSSCTVSWDDDMYRMVMRGLNGTYPDTSRIIPKNPPVKVVMDRQALLAACERVAVLSEERMPAEFRISPEHVRISTKSALYGHAVDTVEVQSSTAKEEMTVFCNIHFWIDLLRAYEEGVEQIEISLINPGQPFTVKPVNGTGLSLIAPILNVPAKSADKRQSA